MEDFSNQKPHFLRLNPIKLRQINLRKKIDKTEVLDLKMK